MALRKQLSFSGETEIKTQYGIVLEANTTVELDAYIKVEEIKTSKTSAFVTVSMTDGDKKLVMTTPFTPSVEAGAKNIIAQAYDALKQMSLFVDAHDC